MDRPHGPSSERIDPSNYSRTTSFSLAGDAGHPGEAWQPAKKNKNKSGGGEKSAKVPRQTLAAARSHPVIAVINFR
jgi:hypothetical protein